MFDWRAQSLLELLFAKFEGLAKGKSLADSLRLLELLRKLATSDTARPDVSGGSCCDLRPAETSLTGSASLQRSRLKIGRGQWFHCVVSDIVWI